jgi:two-component system, NarL family, response regulator DevR
MRPIRVYVVEDSEPYVRGLQEYFNPGGEFVIAGSAGTLADALRKAPAVLPEIAVVDLSILSDPSAETPSVAHGLRAISELKRCLPGLRILAISFSRDANLPGQAVTAGAIGFLNKDASFERWVSALRQVNRGEVVLDEDVIPRLLKPASLTPAELEVLRLIADGHNTAGIAEALHIAQATVQTHLRAIMRKLNCNSRNEAIDKARGLGLL